MNIKGTYHINTLRYKPLQASSALQTMTISLPGTLYFYHFSFFDGGSICYAPLPVGGYKKEYYYMLHFSGIYTNENIVSGLRYASSAFIH